MSTYIEVPRERIIATLEAAGFSRDDVRGEVTYSRRHALDPKLLVKVYTSIPEFRDAARGCGEDAIRVVGLLTWTRQGEDVPRWKKLYQKRVFRVTSVEGVLERMMERAREAYKALNEFRKGQ